MKGLRCLPFAIPFAVHETVTNTALFGKLRGENNPVKNEGKPS